MPRQTPSTYRSHWWQGLLPRVLLLVVAAITVVVALLIAQNYLQTRASATRTVMRQMALVAQVKDSEIANWVDGHQSTLDVLAGSKAMLQWANLVAGDTSEDPGASATALREELMRLLSLVVQEYPGVREIFVLQAPNGVIVASSNTSRLGELRGSEAYFVQGLMGSYMGRAQTSSMTGRTVLIISAPLYAVSGSEAGVLAAELDVDWLQQTILSRSGIVGTWERYLVDRGFQLIVGPSIGQARRPSLWGGAVALIRSGGQSQGGGVGTGIYENHSGEQVIGAFKWIEALDLALVMEANLDDALQSEQQALNVVAPFVIGALLLGLAILLGVLLRNQVVRPLTRLRERALAVASGRLAPSAGQVAPLDLSRATEVRRMQDAFGAALQYLDAQYNALDARVAARTEELQQRSQQLQAAAGVSSAVASVRDVDQLLNEIAQLLPQYFDFDHVGLFLKNDRGDALVLRAASSEGGRRMLARGHKLAVGQGIVGAVAAQGQARIALDVGAEPVFFDNPDLPNTRSEMALPLIVRTREIVGAGPAGEMEVLGVLDVQSERSGAFTDEDVIVFQSVADQVALAIENAHLLGESDQIQRELQRRYGEQVTSAWQRPLLRMDTAFRYTGAEVIPLSDGGPQLDASETFAPFIYESGDGTRELRSPITVRGVRLGSITLQQSADDVPWDAETLAVVEAVCSQVGETLENARLLDEAQVRVGYESLTSEIGERIRTSAADVDEVLRTTLRELAQALGATGTIAVAASGSSPAVGRDNGEEAQ